MKTFELLSIVGSIVAVGVALGAAVIGSNGNLHAELRTETQGLLMEMHADIRALEHRLSAVERRQPRTEGLLEGLRDAIMAQRTQGPREQTDAT